MTDFVPLSFDDETPYFNYTLSIINGKWKLLIIFVLAKYEVVRYNELRRLLGGTITFKMLSNTLKEMENDGLVNRKEYPQIPPKVEYSLTDKGLSLMPVVRAMCDWGGKNCSEHGDVVNVNG
ncbi:MULTISPECIES: helix-turn-helix domain-containing protein [Moraxella]|uniref:HxlR family transcriptional regulator n=1 Tax=Moraxella lacunata TaxID=477 RepID=A0A1B8PVL8_MORLA|nr:MULTISPECIES: helix-turn-helix domain-containing protein [Moraxella]MBE9579411.1 helix-turn-helix transcriptional regulator [Moraxella sp. K1664]MBE9588758.1 helix-turn-helix transcriptional regulator [Moraxella sp. K1630]MBE9591260.1 helix-turn-helix transcriptional regulator [Moraxella sp. K127]MBE9596969.1 helix-turn-helix transcriptional regulator [Moraxella sp. K2450]MDH9219527.1 helix-turn-helix domain-containing protein [Moraxella lacunata]